MSSMEEALELWNIIYQRLSSSELQTCKSLLNDLMSHRRERNQVHASLGRLLKKEDYLHQRFTQLFPYTDNQEEKVRRKVEGDCETPSLEEVRELWKIMDERLSSSEVKTCKSLLEGLKSHRRERNQIHTSLGRLLKKHEYLHQRFTQLFPYCDYDKDGNTQEDTDTEEGEIREEDHLRDDPEIDQAHMRIKESKKIDLANHEMRVKVDAKQKEEEEEDVMYVSPSYRFLEEKEKESSVSETVLNNECVLMKFDATGNKKVTPHEIAMAKCEDEMFHADVLIGTLRSAIRSVEKVLNEEMRFEDLEESFYSFIKKSLRRKRDAVKEYNLPNILTRLKQKEEQLKDDRNSKKSDWQKVFKENSAQ